MPPKPNQLSSTYDGWDAEITNSHGPPNVEQALPPAVGVTPDHNSQWVHPSQLT